MISNINKQAFEGLGILVAEDDEMNREVFSCFFEFLGLKDVRIVADGGEAIAAYRHQSADIVLLDIRMPVMDGIEAMLHIKKIAKPLTSIVALTASAMPGSRRSLLDEGFDDYISKPATLNDMADMMLRYLRKRQATENMPAYGDGNLSVVSN